MRPRRDPRISLGVASYHDPLVSGRMDLAGFLDEAAALGFRTVELCDRTLSLDALDTARRLLDQRDLSLGSIAIRNDFTLCDQADRQVDHVLSWLEAAERLGAPVARVWTGVTHTDAAAREQVAACLHRVAKAAEALGVTAVVETHGGLSNDPGYLVPVLRDLGRSSLGVCVDFGNIPADGRDAVVTEFVPYTSHVHVKTYAFDHSGRDTTVDVARYVTELHAAGFDGFWVIEYEGEPSHRQGVLRTVDLLTATLPWLRT
ncbi:sugar phosphate isomerase/epimerase [Nonomuraea sp. MG754425]|nr:sugar phosphate isomerase/epimerase [Nonomuraea sp. MG754425]